MLAVGSQSLPMVCVWTKIQDTQWPQSITADHQERHKRHNHPTAKTFVALSRLCFHNRIQEGCRDAHCLSRCLPPPALNQGSVFLETSQIGTFEVTAANESDTQKIRWTKEQGARAPMPARIARTPQSSVRVSHSLVGLQTWHCSH